MWFILNVSQIGNTLFKKSIQFNYEREREREREITRYQIPIKNREKLENNFFFLSR